jgi:3-deoxy-manno-octulosonate cytidylyltransferase (CMP-KDO synthetase)
MKIYGIIPARYASSRFPGKPLVMIEGKSMIRRVYEQALQCRELSDVIIATDNDVIEKHVKGFGGNVMMTSAMHRSGTERCNEVRERTEALREDPGCVIINIQGDEPFIHPGQIAATTEPFTDEGVQITTLVRKISSAGEITDPNVVKVVFDRHFRAIYFSRNPIPYFRGRKQEDWLSGRPYYKHVGIYAYRSDILGKISGLPESSLEKAESLEQLRWIENGYSIHVRETGFESLAIDVPEDLLKIANRTGFSG